MARCKPCYLLKTKEWKRAHPVNVRAHKQAMRWRDPEKTRQKAREYYRRNAIRITQQMKGYKLKFAHKELARDILRDHVKRGNIIRPKRCMECGEPADRIEGHHADYSRPLAVIWCCKRCHEKLDQQTAS